MASKKPVSIFKKAANYSVLKTKGRKEIKESKGDAASSIRKDRPRPRRSIPKQSGTGVVYLSHLPHGFYEEQIRGYFSQFGSVRGVKLPRSEKTGGSRGYAYVQFADHEVAQIAADTMNNYLMLNRIVKATLLPPMKGKKIKFNTSSKRHIEEAKPITAETCARAKNRRKTVALKNAIQSNEKHVLMIKREQKKMNKIQKKLDELGIPKLNVIDSKSQ